MIDRVNAEDIHAKVESLMGTLRSKNVSNNSMSLRSIIKPDTFCDISFRTSAINSRAPTVLLGSESLTNAETSAPIAGKPISTSAAAV